MILMIKLLRGNALPIKLLNLEGVGSLLLFSAVLYLFEY